MKPSSTDELNKVVLLLTENPAIHIQISGFTDNVGKESDNLLLSLNRARSVTGYLTGKGIHPKRISFKGFGASKPIADNNTDQGKALNRRTELSITGN